MRRRVVLDKFYFSCVEEPMDRANVRLELEEKKIYCLFIVYCTIYGMIRNIRIQRFSSTKNFFSLRRASKISYQSSRNQLLTDSLTLELIVTTTNEVFKFCAKSCKLKEETMPTPLPKDIAEILGSLGESESRK